jgi:sulfur carrier protein
MITVNQRDHIPWHSDMTVKDLLSHCRYTFPQIIVSVNGNVVPWNAYQKTRIPDGADVRVIHLMAGG